MKAVLPHPDEENPIILWAHIYHLEMCLKGPDGFESWQDAAVHERVRRVAAEARIKVLEGEVERYRQGMANWKATAEEKDASYGKFISFAKDAARECCDIDCRTMAKSVLGI